MKKLLFLSAFIALVSCGPQEPEIVSIPPPPAPVEEASIVANSSSKMFVSGMTCVMGCKGAIEKKLNATPGVVSFEINFEDSTAVAQFNSDYITTEEIISTVNGVAGGGLYTATLLEE